MDKAGAGKFDTCGIIIQARMSSLRFPGKMMSSLGGMPLLGYVCRRCREAGIKKIIVATSSDKSDAPIYGYCRENNISVMRGDLRNVLRRYIKAAELFQVEYIIRVGGDTPFVDIKLTLYMLNMLIENGFDYVSPDRRTCASAFYSEAVTTAALRRAASETDDGQDLEHVTRFIISRPQNFKIKLLDGHLNPAFINGIRLTIDYPEDILRANKVVNELDNKFSFTSQDVLAVIKNGLLQ